MPGLQASITAPESFNAQLANTCSLVGWEGDITSLRGSEEQIPTTNKTIDC